MIAKFSIGEVVRKAHNSTEDRVGGFVKHLTCHAATKSGGGKCDRNTCRHEPKTDIWVKWPNGQLCSYGPSELNYDQEGETEVLASLNDMIGSGDKEEVEDATIMLQQLIQARRAREAYNATQEEGVVEPQEHVEVVASTPSMFGMIKQDAVKAGYRVAAKQISTGVQNALVELIKKKGADNSQIEGLAMFMETDIGSALLSTAAGYGLTYVPMISKDPRAQKLAKEFRVAGIATAGNAVFQTLIDQLAPIINGALNNPLLGEASVEEVSANEQTKSLQAPLEENQEDEAPVLQFEEIEQDEEIFQALEEESKRGIVNGN